MNIVELFTMAARHGAVLDENTGLHWNAIGFVAFAKELEGRGAAAPAKRRGRPPKKMAKPQGRPPGSKDKQPRKRRGQKKHA